MLKPLLLDTQRKRDCALLETVRDGHEAEIANAARRQAFEYAADWLSIKQAKAEMYPGASINHANGRAEAYRNAAQKLYSWAMAQGTKLPRNITPEIVP